MSDPEQDSAKVFDPTPQKLLEARKKGEVAKSTDLMTAAGYVGLLAALLLSGASGIQEAGNALMVMLDQAASIAPLFFDGSPQAPLAGLISQTIKGLSPIFVFPILAVILSIFAQRAWVFAPSKFEPKLSRISPISNAKNKFGRAGLFEWFKSFIKLLLYSVVLAFFISDHMPSMIAVLQTEQHLVLSLLSEMCITFLFIVVLISATIGSIDAIWQHFEHIRKNRMSHKDIMDETKESEGDPHLKQERRQRAMSVAQNQMMADVPNADVIIVNPTHFAVALKWSRAPGDAPICVAKGVDEIAAAIRKSAQLASVPIHHDPPTARSLYATTEIGQQIEPDFYAAVAAAIRFSETMRQRAKTAI